MLDRIDLSRLLGFGLLLVSQFACTAEVTSEASAAGGNVESAGAGFGGASQVSEAGSNTTGGASAAGAMGGVAGAAHPAGVAGSAPVAGAGGMLATAGAAGAKADAGAGGSGGAGGAVPQSKLVHPGIMNSAAELASIKARVQAKQEPWASAFNALSASSYGSLGYQAKAYATVECGSYNMPNIGCSQMVDDGMAAYAHALIWNATGELAHANKAIEIIDAWAKVYQKNLQSNSPLVVGWATPWYANAAEILRYSPAGWSTAGIARFTSLLELWLPYVDKDEGPTNNWMQSRIEAHLAIAVFLDDPTELEKAEARWNVWLPQYVLDSGLSTETCRDLLHLGLGIRSMMNAAETAWQQGTDLFGPNRARLAKFIELHGSWMLGKASVPANVCAGKIIVQNGDTQGIQPPTGGGRLPLEIMYSQLHGRLGMELPNARAMIAPARPIGAGHWVLKWETLTHASAL